MSTPLTLGTPVTPPALPVNYPVIGITSETVASLQSTLAALVDLPSGKTSTNVVGFTFTVLGNGAANASVRIN